MSASIDNRHFVLRRLQSLLGLVPIGAFLVFHLWESSQVRLGASHYNEAVAGALQQINYLPAIEIFMIALPIPFHACYGLVIVRQARPELARYPWMRNWRIGCSASRGSACWPFCFCTSG